MESRSVLLKSRFWEPDRDPGQDSRPHRWHWRKVTSPPIAGRLAELPGGWLGSSIINLRNNLWFILCVVIVLEGILPHLFDKKLKVKPFRPHLFDTNLKAHLRKAICIATNHCAPNHAPAWYISLTLAANDYLCRRSSMGTRNEHCVQLMTPFCALFTILIWSISPRTWDGHVRTKRLSS